MSEKLRRGLSSRRREMCGRKWRRKMSRRKKR